MMRRIMKASLGLAILTGLALPLAAQRNPRGKAEVTLKGKLISVEYGRPSLRGRTVNSMLSKLKPGDFWRLGADQSTTFTTGVALAFGKVTVPAGTYSLWAQKKAGGHWALVFNRQHGQWGTQHDPKRDFATVPLHEKKVSGSAEMVTIDLTKKRRGAEVSIQWGDLKLVTEFTAS